ncbi:MAG: DEAD/DEAH box helicase, partial [Bacteroidota bacterium]
MLTNGRYFEAFPAKVLGQYFTHNPNTGKLLTDQFGKPRPEVRGTMEDLAKIEVPTVKRHDHFIPQTASTPILQKPTEQKSKIQKAIDRSKDQGKAKKATQGLTDRIIKYNSKVEYKDANGQTKHYKISNEEMAVFVTYQVQEGLYDRATIESNDWKTFLLKKPNWKAQHKRGLVAYNGKKYIPSTLFYSGNIYQNLRDLEAQKDQIISEIGADGYQKQMDTMHSMTPKRLRISEDQREKLYLSPFDKIWDEINITELADGTDIESNLSIGSIFYRYYLQNLGEEDFIFDNKRTTAYEVYNYWVEKENFPRGTAKDRKAAIKRNTTIIGQKLFDRFLIEALSRDDKNRIEQIWNSTRNNYRPFDYYKIPVGFSRVNSRFKGGTLSIRPAQREGVAFMNSRGTGIVAYDVGVGKTMTSILAIDDGFTKGLFKRPLVVVPQKVYKKWISEIVGVKAEKDIYQTVKGKKQLKHKKGEIISEGILPNVKVNDYDNLGTNFIHRAMDKTGIAYTVDKYSVTMVTYEGLSKIGFNAQTEGILAKRLNEALSQGESGRAAALQSEKSQEYIDQALAKTELDIEEMGIDAIIVDEAHNFRNLFMDVKGDVGKDGEREQKNFFSNTGSKPSARALNLFMLNAYIQDKHQRRNTFGLTATPFTNRATEIYSMLSLYDYEGMKDFDCYNIAQFCTTFIDETMEDAWTAAGKFEPKPVIRGYNNLPTLQSMIYRSINYKTGEEANIQRPERVVLPLTHDENGVPLSFEYIVDTKLKPSTLQQSWLSEITNFASKERKVRNESKLAGYYEEDEKGRIPGQTLIALNASRAVTFSPYALSLGGTPQFDQSQITPAQFVDNSPKIKYAIECIRSVKDYHDRQSTAISGQVIYSDRGKDWFGHIRQYLIENVGFSDQQVAIFHGGVSKGKREKIKEGFLDGSIKVIIGSSTLREGVDLQKYGSTGYVCYIDWNPTDVHQLFGRIWRFGNKFSHVRWVVPLIENSSDIFTWQKLSEKMSRLNSIWSKANGTKLFEESELNAEELKKGLINDPIRLAEYEVEEAVAAIKSELSIVRGKLGDLRSVETMLQDFKILGDELEKEAKQAIINPHVNYDTKPEQKERLLQMELSDQKSIYRIVRAYAKLKGWYGYSLKGKVERHIKIAKRLSRLDETILAPFNLSVGDDLTPIIEKIEGQEEQLLGGLEQIKSQNNL